MWFLKTKKAKNISILSSLKIISFATWARQPSNHDTYPTLWFLNQSKFCKDFQLLVFDERFVLVSNWVRKEESRDYFSLMSIPEIDWNCKFWKLENKSLQFSSLVSLVTSMDTGSLMLTQMLRSSILYKLGVEVVLTTFCLFCIFCIPSSDGRSSRSQLQFVTPRSDCALQSLLSVID